jgi:hypothetical protein
MIKAFLGLRRLIETGVIGRGERVVLLHTGGQVDLFGGHSLGEWYRARYADLIRT